jgi:hypothetical protein
MSVAWRVHANWVCFDMGSKTTGRRRTPSRFVLRRKKGSRFEDSASKARELFDGLRARNSGGLEHRSNRFQLVKKRSSESRLAADRGKRRLAGSVGHVGTLVFLARIGGSGLPSQTQSTCYAAIGHPSSGAVSPRRSPVSGTGERPEHVGDPRRRRTGPTLTRQRRPAPS